MKDDQEVESPGASESVQEETKGCSSVHCASTMQALRSNIFEGNRRKGLKSHAFTYSRSTPADRGLNLCDFFPHGSGQRRAVDQIPATVQYGRIGSGRGKGEVPSMPVEMRKHGRKQQRAHRVE